MATRKKPGKKVKFELSRSSIGGIAVVLFCAFLWMFLLGIWAGQTVLVSNEITQITTAAPVKKPQHAPRTIYAEKRPVKLLDGAEKKAVD
ncbi:MAG: hypothetical protein CSA20_03380 [Deltaproteobacteria bacterium]|nr:MAG: hypothetical protein CSB23_02630 [Deltaproteobacteria bacterium]PIE73142.1 MAG: hypothetical protein CSA20_03380 [Deltaproteobacteria bacterium]